MLERLSRSFPDSGRILQPLHPQLAITEGGNWLDRAVIAVIVILVVVPPLFMGSTHPWAFIAAELAIFAAAVVGLIKVVLYPSIIQQIDLKELRSIVVPLGLFLALVTCQLIPLPPTVLHIISPSTYRLYATTLSGWPATAPYEQLFERSRSGSVGAGDSTANKSLVNQSDLQPERRIVNVGGHEPSRWRPLSVAPQLTLEWLIKLLSYTGLFFIVALYPFGQSERSSAQERFYSYVRTAMLVSGLIVAGIGILELAFWNGKILWVFVPYDWIHSPPDHLWRASGPFVNPDHFGSFLNLVLPVAVAGTLFPMAFTRRDAQAFQVICAVAMLVISVALMMSLSRAGWLGALVGLSTLLFLVSFVPHDNRPRLLRLPPRIWVPLCAVTVLLSLAIISLFVGGESRHEADLQLKEAINQHETLGFRINVWRDTLPMLGDYPLFGIGLGAFQDLFPHYQHPPWNPHMVRQTHNDYLELLVSAGTIGFGLLGWFLAAVGHRLYKGIRRLPPGQLLLVAPLIAAISAMAFQELFDFNLQIPANAILLTITLALATRSVTTLHFKKFSAAPSHRYLRVLVGTLAVAVITLSWIAISQNKVPYPYNLKVPSTPEEARSLVLAHPANSNTHLWLIGKLQNRIALMDQTKELAAAVWLDPTNPTVRDLYARSLLLGGDLSGALKQISLSVFNSPWLDNHYYLQQEKSRKMLSPLERAAIEDGLGRAVASNFHNAVWAFGGLYDSLGEFGAEGDLYARTATSPRNPNEREALLLEAARAHARVGQMDEASSELKQASALDPADSQPYVRMVALILKPRNDLPAAKAIVKQGIANGADASALNLALADAARSAGDLPTEEAALTAAVNAHPSDFDVLSRLTSFYMGEKRFSQAVLIAHRGGEIHPDSAAAFDQLGLAEEADYQYFAAERDLQHAVDLAPGDATIKAHLQNLQRQAASSSTP